jgi:hypothetical protein
VAANKKQRLSLVDAIQSKGAVKNTPSSALAKSDFDYALIKDVDARKFLSEQAIEIKNLLVDSLRLHQKAEEILDQSTQSLVDAGRGFAGAKARIGHGQWGGWLRDEFSQTFIDIGVITQDDALNPLTIERKVQELIQFARTIDTEPEHQDLMKLSNVKPYLLARLTAPSTPKAARSEVVAQIQQAEAEQKPLPGAKAVRAAVARHNPKPSETRTKVARSLAATPAPQGLATSGDRAANPSPAKSAEIVAVIPAAPAPATTQAVDIETQTLARSSVKPRHLYLCGKHVLFSGSPADPQWAASLPRSTDSDGKALFDLLTDYSESSEPVVVQINGQIFAACKDLNLLADIIDEWSLLSGKQVIEQPLRH